jgi:V/A-type H+-transporting ATPase subunit I
MRYDVKKFLFVGVEKERDAFFKRAQDAGIINFINTKPIKIKEELEEVKTFSKAISILRGFPVVEQEETYEYDIGLGLAKKINTQKDFLDKLYESERIIKLEMSRVEAFGDFSIQDIAEIEKQTGRKVQFYCAKHGFAENHELPENVIYITSDHGLDYFMAINKEPSLYPKMIEMQITRSWGELNQEHEKLLDEISVTEHNLKGYAKYSRFLHQAFVHELNEFHLNEAKGMVDFPIHDEDLFVVQGWVPAHKMDQLDEIVKEMGIFVEEINIEPKDVVPTFLENKGAARIGEDLVHIYDTPSKEDKDPSLWVLVFFSLFFAMIIGDGGYGLIMLLIALYIRYKHQGLKSYKKRALNLLTILGFSVLAWGVLTTSFFGIKVAPNNPFRKVSLMTWLVEKKAQYHMAHKDEIYMEWVKKYPELVSAKDPKEFLMKAAKPDSNGVYNYEVYAKFADNIMMELALLIGVIHIIISMLRHTSRNWAYIGWVLVIIGAYLYAPTFLNASTIPNFVLGIDREEAGKNGLHLIYGGLILAVVIALFQHKWLGLLEATLGIQIFGDAMSYMRLYALGLSGSLLTDTMIDLAASVPLIFGILILIFGHTVNIVLGVMSGVIHGLRLNFLEWYHYSFEGGGRMFNPLRKKEIE